MNDIATVELETSSPLFFDAYRHNRTTGSFILIDPLTNATLAAGMILEDLSRGIENPAERGSALARGQSLRSRGTGGTVINPQSFWQMRERLLSRHWSAQSLNEDSK